ncbi:MAG TPA: Clp protease N-terminal domain-containing protein [Acidimicrobiia bacterium]
MEPSRLSLEDLIELVVDDAGDDPLQHVSRSVEIAGHLGDLADRLIGHYVEEARRSGSSWAEIGQSLGVTKQAAQKRFVLHGVKSGDKGSGLFTRFAQPAREVVKRAVAHAQGAAHDQIGTEHLILGLIDDPESTAARVIVELGASLDEIRSETEVLLAGRGASLVRGHIPFSADSKKALQLALREAIRAGDRHIGTEHILLGILRDESLPGVSILVALGVTRSKAEAMIRSAPS